VNRNTVKITRHAYSENAGNNINEHFDSS